MNILNFGSLNLDYVYRVPHFVRPGETLSSVSMQTFCGGKGLNQSIALARAGAQVFHAGQVGPEGDILLQKLRDAGVDTSFVRAGSNVTGHAIIQVDAAGQNCILLHGGANREIDADFVTEVLRHFGKGDILLLQNETSALPSLLSTAAERGLRVAFNPSPFDDAIRSLPLQAVTWFLLNETEGQALTGESEPDAICTALLEKHPGSAVVLTLGPRGVLYRTWQTRQTFGVYPVPVVDTTGAGDTFTGYFLAGILAGLEAHETLRRASAASSLAVSHNGASDSIPCLNDTLAFLQTHSDPEDLLE